MNSIGHTLCSGTVVRHSVGKALRVQYVCIYCRYVIKSPVSYMWKQNAFINCKEQQLTLLSRMTWLVMMYPRFHWLCTFDSSSVTGLKHYLFVAFLFMASINHISIIEILKKKLLKIHHQYIQIVCRHSRLSKINYTIRCWPEEHVLQFFCISFLTTITV